jgi:hypothetical protein
VLLSLLVVGATLWPLAWEPGRDSFPLSPYPMFSDIRERQWLDVIVGFDAAGNEHKIPSERVASFEVMQTAQTIRLAVRRRRAKQLCEQVAERVAADAELEHIVTLEVQRRQFDPRTYFVSDDGKVPLGIRRKARCPIERGGVERGGTD